jgi:hypothetical protein
VTAAARAAPHARGSLDVHAIRCPEHRHLRCVDREAWDELRTGVAEDAPGGRSSLIRPGRSSAAHEVVEQAGEGQRVVALDAVAGLGHVLDPRPREAAQELGLVGVAHHRLRAHAP